MLTAKQKQRAIKRLIAVCIAATTTMIAAPAATVSASTKNVVRIATATAGTPGVLAGVSLASAKNGWAVGCTPSSNPDFGCPGFGDDVALHYTGTKWQSVHVPMKTPAAGGSPLGELYGVTTISTSDAWAVGYSDAGAQIVHYNGTAWKQVTPPQMIGTGGTNYRLYSVSASSATDVWAVGYAESNGFTAVTVHYNGTSWKMVPSVGGITELTSVVDVSSKDAWAVGTGSGGGASYGLTLHWDGKSWSSSGEIYPSDNTQLLSVTASSATNAWLAGGADFANGEIIEHYNGTSWKLTEKGMNPNGQEIGADSMATLSATNTWAAGCIGPTVTTAVAHYGGTWKFQPTPTEPPANWSCLYGISVTSQTNAWAVGAYQDTSALDHYVMLHYNGTKWTRVVV
jgi:hypothetical protein